MLGHEPTLIATTGYQMTASSPRGTFSQAELTADRVITRCITQHLTTSPIASDILFNCLLERSNTSRSCHRLGAQLGSHPAKRRQESGGVWTVICPGKQHFANLLDSPRPARGLLHTEEVTGSIPVSPTRSEAMWISIKLTMGAIPVDRDPGQARRAERRSSHKRFEDHDHPLALQAAGREAEHGTRLGIGRNRGSRLLKEQLRSRLLTVSTFIDGHAPPQRR
jgi:hypothetical protein